MKALSLYIIYFLITYLSFACSNAKKKVSLGDNFYTNTRLSWDAIRIPLLKPYELIQLNGSKEWSMNLLQTPASISNVQSVNVLQDIFIVHANETYCNNEKVAEGWFVFKPKDQIEKGFKKKNDFDKFIQFLRVKNTIFYNVDTVYEMFSKNGIINWGRGF